MVYVENHGVIFTTDFYFTHVYMSKVGMLKFAGYRERRACGLGRSFVTVYYRGVVQLTALNL